MLDRANLSVLLVEDNPGDRRLAELALREAADEADIHCEVCAKGTLAAGLAWLAEHGKNLDAVLLDLGLPDAKGMDGLLAVRAARSELPVIVLTGLSDLAAATRALALGAADYVDKADVQPRPLLRAIRYAIERKKSESELVRLASTDPLTGLLNRRAFFEKLGQALANARRSRLACAMLMLDIDRFKEVNDLFGHGTGDKLLIAVARALEGQLRDTDILARLGGDEFAIVATHLRSADAAIEIADKVVAAVLAIPDLDGKRIDTGVSVGVSVFPMDDVDPDTFASHADIALYKSKTGRRGSINYYDAEMDVQVKAAHELRRRMPGDIADGKFVLHFQPIVDAHTGVIVAAEGLARWRDDEEKFIPPSDFIPLAEQSGLIADLAARLLEDACACLRGWLDAGLSVVPVSLNVSPTQCRDQTFGLKLVATIAKFRIPPSLINIEITESTIINSLDITRENLRVLKAAGIGIHIDDFGTGYSSLSLLKDLPFDALKIDRSFVSDLGTGTGSESIVQAVIELGRQLGFEIIAEGVETEEQAGILARAGVDRFQGYRFSRPVDAEAFGGLLSPVRQGRSSPATAASARILASADLRGRNAPLNPDSRESAPQASEGMVRAARWRQ